MSKTGNSKAQYIIQHQHLADTSWNEIKIQHEDGGEVVFIQSKWMVQNPLKWLKGEFESWMLENDDDRGLVDSFQAFIQSRPHQLLTDLHDKFRPALPDSLGASIEESEEVKMKFYAELLGECINGLLGYYKKRQQILGMFDDDGVQEPSTDTSTPLDALLN